MLAFLINGSSQIDNGYDMQVEQHSPVPGWRWHIVCCGVVLRGTVLQRDHYLVSVLPVPQLPESTPMGC